MNREAVEKVESIIDLDFVDKPDAGELHRYMKETDDCKRILGDSRDKKLAGNSFTKETMTSGDYSSGSGAVLHRKDAVAVLRRPMATSSSQDLFLSSQ